MNKNDACIFVVDDDDSVRASLQRLLRASGWGVEAFASASDFLSRLPIGRVGCLLLDVRMPQITGPQLQDQLAEAGLHLPVIFLTAHGDVPTTVQAMKKGAVDFLLKPVDDTVLLEAIHRAVEDLAQKQVRLQRIRDIQARIERLSSREHEVMRHVVCGRLNKQIAGDLLISEKTVKIHRAHVMEKMGIRSVAELVRLFDMVAAVSPRPPALQPAPAVTCPSPRMTPRAFHPFDGVQ